VRTLIHSARLVSDGRVTENGWVLFDGGRIARVGSGMPPVAEPGPVAELVEATTAETVVDARGRWLAPGFIDIHCHGAGGAAFDEGAGSIRTALAVHRAHGTTRSVLSLVTAALPDLERQLEVIAAVARSDELVLGAHLEGPFLEVEHKGAHDQRLLSSPTGSAIDRLLAAGDGRIRQITIAPELPGGMAALDRFVTAGVAVAIGHTGTDYETAREAFERGATILTHAFNGMNGIHHRAPGPVAAATRDEHVTIEIIGDGVHVHPEVIRLTCAAAPGRIALVTDAMAATGSGDGEYTIGGLDVLVVDGVARLRDGGSIAGSTLTQDAALRFAVNQVGLPIEAAVHALTQAPAHAIGRVHDLGRLHPGYLADAVLLEPDLTVAAVWAAGERLR
jgi:N-acetylglucosamine-6-phosphate deacetylase